MMEATLFHTENHDVYNPEKTKYEEVWSKSYRIGNIMKGIYSYIPIEFDECFASWLSTTVHCCVNNFSLFRRLKMWNSVQELKSRKILYEI